MQVCTAEQMRELDRATIEDLGIPGVVLMEMAGRGVADLIASLGPVDGLRVAVLCGAGNNGGDGYVVARHLAARGARVVVFLVADRARIAGDALTNLRVIEQMGLEIRALQTDEEIDGARSTLVHAGVIVDALLGTGLKSAVRGRYRSVLERANHTSGVKVAVDIPSGLNADTGEVMGVAFAADHTVTFGLPKVGLVTHPGVERVGQLHVVDIGIPPQVVGDAQLAAELLEPEWIGRRLLHRPSWGHKGTYGHLLVIAGSPGKTGAAVLCGEAALRCGGGLVTVASPPAAMSAMESKTREVMLASLLPDGVELDDTEPVLEHCLELLRGKDAVALGPGIPRSAGMARLVCGLVKEAAVPVVVDADGLNELAGDLGCLKDASVPVLLTPHPGEMSRLTGLPVAEIQRNRLAVARDFATEHGAHLALKGNRTVIAAPDGRCYVNPTGNTGMGSGGTGDVLTGMVGGFVAQGHDPLDALALGVFVHGMAGDAAAERNGQRGLLASDLLAETGRVLKRWE